MIEIILNPYANRWGAQARVAALQEALTAVSLPYHLSVTERPFHGTELARQAAQNGAQAVIAAGGDGTISEVINGLIQAAGERVTVPFGVLPFGTANDFSDMAGLPRDLSASLRLMQQGKTQLIDAARVNDHYFLNNCAVAMEPMVTLENIRMKRFSGELRYVVALIRALVKLQAWQMAIEWDDGGYTGPTYLLSVCNGPRTGGFYMAPTASFTDGQLDFVFAPQVSKLTVLAILLRLFRQTHIAHPDVIYGRTQKLTLTSQPGTPIHADGEIIAEAATAVAYEVLPQKIQLLTDK